MAVADVVETLMRRLIWHESSPTAAPVLDAEVLAWGAEILLGLGPPNGRLGRRASEDDVHALAMVGSLYLYRAQSKSDDEGDQELDAAFSIFALLLPHHGDALSDEVRDALAEALASPEWIGPADGLNAWNEAGVVHLRAAAGRADAVGLDHAVALFEQAEQVGPPDHPARLLIDVNLSYALRLRAESRRDPADARVAVARAKAALARMPTGEAEFLSWANLVAAQFTLANLGEPGATDAAVDSAKRAEAAVEAASPGRPQILANLGAALRQRHLADGGVDDLLAALRATREAWILLAAQPSSLLRVQVDLNLGMLLLDMYLQERRPDYLADAIGRLVRSAAELPDDYADRFGVAEGLVRARLYRMDASGEEADRDAAMVELADAIQLPTHDATKVAAMRGILGELHRDRWIDLGDFKDLNSAMGLLARSSTELPADHPLRTQFQTSLASCLRTRFAHTLRSEDLLWALELLQQLCAREDPAPIAEQLRALVRSDLANLDGDVDALRQSAQVLRDALDGRDGDGLRRALGGLATVLTHLARHSGAPGDLAAAIDTARQAVAGSHGLARSGFLATLSAPLVLRFQTDGGLSDLDEAIDVLDQAIAQLPAQHQLRRLLQSDLGFCLTTRYNRVGDEQDLARSIACQRQSLLHDTSDEIGGGRQIRLVGALVQAFIDFGDRAALPEAIDRSRSAVARAVPGSQNHCIALGWLARALSQQAMADNDRSLGDEAVTVIRRAMEVAAFEGPTRSGLRSILARILWQRQTLEPEPARQIEAVIDAYRGVVDDLTALLRERFDAAAEWAMIADDAGRSALALEGYCHAARLLPEAAWRGVHRRDQLQVLAANKGLAQLAARSAVANGQPALAVELAECARTVLAGQALQMRRDLHSLRREAPELATRMVELAAVLDDTGLSTLDGNQAARPLDQRIQAAREWQQVYADAARVLGSDATFPPDQPTYARMAAALTSPVAYINVTSTDCVALLIHPGSIQPSVVDLPDLREEDIDAAVSTLRRAAPGRASRDLEPFHARQTLTETLAWLWDTVVEPILTAVGAAAPVPNGVTWPRLVWCPSGALARLPLHAAQPRQGPGALDLVVSSYTTSLRALLRPRSVGSETTLLVVSAPAVPGLSPLPAASDEALALSRIVGRTRVLEGSQATPADVLAAIPAHTCVHFACHAGWTDGSPADTPRLALTTGDITPLDLAGLRLDGADLAYLSACDTTVGLPDAADEGLHIAGAIQLAGFRHVISTLWTIRDSTAAELAEEAYRGMTGQDRVLQPSRAPEALHQAVRDLRRRSPHTPELWAPFLHLGGFTR